MSAPPTTPPHLPAPRPHARGPRPDRGEGRTGSRQRVTDRGAGPARRVRPGRGPDLRATRFQSTGPWIARLPPGPGRQQPSSPAPTGPPASAGSGSRSAAAGTLGPPGLTRADKRPRPGRGRESLGGQARGAPCGGRFARHGRSRQVTAGHDRSRQATAERSPEPGAAAG